MSYFKLCDKDLTRHSDPAKRRKIVRAKLREMVTGRLSQAQRLLLETMVPLYLELDEMAQQYGDDDFDMQRYLSLQAAFRSSFAQLSGQGRKHKVASNKPEERGFDLGVILGRQ
ncbi:MAG: hypothetical protein CXZ00_16280 [Acidobacteria bacterium]|nr:MAG: hypothetical protein CXZ00_16280 [Acidobacteriota bacterium]